MLNRRALVLGTCAFSLAPSIASAAYNGTISIIDIHGKSSVEPEAAAAAGVRAVIHKASEGRDFADPKYRERKLRAKKLGLLWGSFHFANGNDVATQVQFYIERAQIEADDLVCLDFEHNKGHEMKLWQAHEFIQRFRDKTGRYPVLYGGAWLRDQIGKKPDPIFEKCPLWYRRYAPHPIAMPTHIWRQFAMWQYTDGQKQYGELPHIVNGIRCDRSFFNGSESELKAAWPFNKATWPFT